MINNELIKLMENINIKEVPKNEHSTKTDIFEKILNFNEQQKGR